MASIIERLKEPSTHAGIGLLFQVLTYAFPQYAAVFNSLTGLFASVAVVMKEKRQGNVNVTVEQTPNSPAVVVSTNDPASIGGGAGVSSTNDFNNRGG